MSTNYIKDMSRIKFRFQDLEVWKDSVELTKELLILAAELDKKKQFSFADQLKRAVLSISNNIAEGSGSDSTRDFGHFITIAKRSVDDLHPGNTACKEEILSKLDRLSRKLTNFKKSLFADSK